MDSDDREKSLRHFECNCSNKCIANENNCVSQQTVKASRFHVCCLVTRMLLFLCEWLMYFYPRTQPNEVLVVFPNLQPREKYVKDLFYIECKQSYYYTIWDPWAFKFSSYDTFCNVNSNMFRLNLHLGGVCPSCSILGYHSVL